MSLAWVASRGDRTFATSPPSVLGSETMLLRWVMPQFFQSSCDAWIRGSTGLPPFTKNMFVKGGSPVERPRDISLAGEP